MTRRSWMLASLKAKEARELAQEALRGQEEEPEQLEEGDSVHLPGLSRGLQNICILGIDSVKK